jgi:CO dehydrogenase maturation factor
LLRSGDIGDSAVVADLEAGLGTLTRMGEQPVDVVLLVVEPSAKSIEVARRAIALLAGRPIGQLVVVANKVTGDADVDRLRDALGDVELVSVPEDPEVRAADRGGVSPLDAAPDAPAVRALLALGEQLLAGGRRS